MSANSHTPTRVAPFLTILFLLFSVGGCFMVAYNHNDNAPVENVVRNDDWSKMGATGYTPNHQATPVAAEATVATTEEHAAEGDAHAADAHKADAHKAEDHKAEDHKAEGYKGTEKAHAPKGH